MPGWLLLFQLLTAFVWFRCPYRPLLVCQPLSQHHLFVLVVPFLITRQRRLFCSFICCGTLTCYGMGALSPFVPYDMHLVVPTHPYFFWVVCHPNRIFPPKELEQEPQNRFSHLPTAKPYSLTSDPWPIISCIGWVQAGEVWALRVLNFCVCPRLARCVCCGLEAPLHILPLILDFLWRELLSDSSFSMAHSL